IHKCLSTIVLLLLVVSTHAGQKGSHDIAEISFETGGNTCGGPCADYKVTIRKDGSVTYEGGVNVKQLGVKNVSVPRANFDLLASKATEIRFYDLQDYYGGIEIDGSHMSM